MDKRAECLQVLGLPPDATFEQAKEAHRDLLQVWHPDRFAHSQRLQQQAQEKSAEINAALTWLKENPHRPTRFERASTSKAVHDESASVEGEVAALRPKGGSRAPVFILAGLVIALALGAAWWFHQRDRDIPVLLSVTTQPPTEVTIIPHGDLKNGFDVGETPLEKVSGAFVGDTVILRNREHGIEHQQVIGSASSDEEVKIEKSFSKGELVVTSEPLQAGLELWRGEVRLGALGAPVSLYQGAHQLTVRGKGLKRPIAVSAPVEPAKRTHLFVELATGHVRAE